MGEFSAPPNSVRSVLIALPHAAIYVVEDEALHSILTGMWCSGITSASHAEGPGFEPRRVHFASRIAVFECRNHFSEKMSLPGFEPGLSRPQRDVLTTRR